VFFPLARLWVRLAAFLLPPAARAQWIGGWDAELLCRLHAPLPTLHFLRITRGILLDARFTRDRSEAPRTDPLWRRPLVLEIAALAACTAIWLPLTAGPPALPPESSLHRAAFVQRSYPTMAVSLSMTTMRLQEQLRNSPAFAGAAFFRFHPGALTSASVSRNFFALLCVRPALGDTFTPETSLDAIVLTDHFWRSRFSADPSLPGRRVMLDDHLYLIAGILPPDFVFASRRIQFYGVLPEGARGAGALILRKPGVSWQQAAVALRKAGSTAEPGWGGEAFHLEPYLQSRRRRDIVFPALAMAAGFFLIGGSFLASKTNSGPRAYAALAIRLLLSMTALSEMADLVARWAAENLYPVALMHLWFFVMSGLAVFLFTLRDHRARCPECLRRLRMPTSFGTWSSLVVDAPATQYACPEGHGLLYQKEVGTRRSSWTRLDQSWRDLFVRW
jgi:hypothetical protein